jgi:hypothetical protein
MKLDNALLSITPETLNTVDIYVAISKIFLMIELHMPVSAEHESITASEPISVHDTFCSHFFTVSFKRVFAVIYTAETTMALPHIFFQNRR